jgi:hypothetical protein
MSNQKYFTVIQFVDKHQAFNTGGIRALIFNEHSNGLAKSCAVIRIGRKVLIDEAKFFEWIESQNKSGLIMSSGDATHGANACNGKNQKS